MVRLRGGLNMESMFDLIVKIDSGFTFRNLLREARKGSEIEAPIAKVKVKGLVISGLSR